MTKQEALARMAKHWQWLAENPRIGDPLTLKMEYFDTHGLGYVHNDCYACEYATHDISGRCGGDCIIPWSSEGDGGCMGNSSEYEKWESAKTKRTQVKYAKIIRDMALHELQKYS